MIAGRWRKVDGKWLVAVDGDLLSGVVLVVVAKSNGTSETHSVAHSKHCTCESGHVYFVQRPRQSRSRALSFCGR